MSEQTSAQRSVRDVIRAEIDPVIGADGIPRCHLDCPQHDGKRCKLMGRRPDALCEPAMDDMAKVIEAAYAALTGRP